MVGWIESAGLTDRLVFSLPTANIAPKSQGGTVFVDAGTATCIGSPVIDFSGIAASTLLGEFVAVNGKKKRVFLGGHTCVCCCPVEGARIWTID